MKRFRPTERSATVVRVAPAAGVVFAALVVSWHEQGSIARGDWLPFAVLVPLVLMTVLLFSDDASVTRTSMAAVLALVALAVWTALSIAWTPVPAVARDESLLLILYASSLALPPLALKKYRGLKEGAGERLAVVGVVAAAAALLAVGAAVHLVVAASPDDFVGARLTFPVSYVNANGAAFLLGFWAATAVAADRGLSLAVRVPAAGAAGAGVGGGGGGPGKGGGIALAASVVVVLALSPLRLRLLLAAAMPAVVVAFAY